MVDALDVAHEHNLADIQLYPTKEWLYQVQVCSDDAQSSLSQVGNSKRFSKSGSFRYRNYVPSFDITELPNNLSPMSIRLSLDGQENFGKERPEKI